MGDKIRSFIPALLSIIITTGFFTLLGALVFGGVTIQDSQIMLMLLGMLASSFGMVMQFWFGTTSGSAQKTDIIAKSIPADIRDKL